MYHICSPGWSNLGVYLSTTKAFTQITSRKMASHMSRRKKENARKAKSRKRKRGESAIVSFTILQLIDEFTYLLCFPEGYNSHRSQHAVSED